MAAPPGRLKLRGFSRTRVTLPVILCGLHLAIASSSAITMVSLKLSTLALVALRALSVVAQIEVRQEHNLPTASPANDDLPRSKR